MRPHRNDETQVHQTINQSINQILPSFAPDKSDIKSSREFINRDRPTVGQTLQRGEDILCSDKEKQAHERKKIAQCFSFAPLLTPMDS